ncbi:MAG: hypothetical protein ACQCXQ_01790 [Verrucomicrobiales bacterium]|nr:hypothetical protein [Verrucomicrobiota bacterium JB025]
MKPLFQAILACLIIVPACFATTITVIPIFEPLSLHGTDSDEAPSDTEEALQACVLSRPKAMTGAFPEVLVDAIRSPHLIPTNNPNYQAAEANLLVLCNIGIETTMTDDGLMVRFNVAQLTIPEEVDLTSRQILKLAIIAVRKTLEQYQAGQTQPLDVTLVIDGTDEGKRGLLDLASRFTVDPLTSR